MNRPPLARLGRWATLFAAAIVLAACGTTTPPTNPAVTNVEIDGGNTTVAIGQSVTLAATVTATGGAATTVTWASDDDTVATVDATTGEVTGVAVGTAQITATSTFNTAVADTITVTVTDPGVAAVTNVAIDGGNRTIGIGGSVTLAATVTATGGAPTTVTWSGSNAFATVDATTGALSGVAAGTAQITATSTFDPTVSDTITVTVVDVDPTNVFVDASAAPGGNGSAALPFQTIADGIFFVQAGGTVNVAAGTYPESLYIPKPFVLVGAGEGLVTIEATGSANGPFSVGAIDIDGIDTVDGLSLSGFTLDLTVAEADAETAAAITIYRGATGVTIEDVTIVHSTDDESNVHGINVGGPVATGTVSNVALTRITIEATGDLVLPNEYTNGAGVNVQGNVVGLVIDDLTTSGHERGLSLDPQDGTIDGVEITTTAGIAEVNRMSVLYDGTGTVTNLDAPSFAAAVGNFTPEYGSNNWFFYKESIDIAIRDSMFNFTQADAWLQSYVQELDLTDQAIRLPRFHIGQANGAFFENPGTDRNLLLQPAIDAAAIFDDPVTIVLQENVTSGDLDPDDVLEPETVFEPNALIDVDGLTIEGEGGTSVLVASSGSVLTIDAANVTISGVTIDGPAPTGITLTAAATGFSVTGSNLLTATALDNTIEVAGVTATGNWWGDASGPGGDGPGTGNLLVDPGGDVDVTGSLPAPVP